MNKIGRLYQCYDIELQFYKVLASGKLGNGYKASQRIFVKTTCDLKVLFLFK